MNNDLGKTMKELREQKGLTQQQLADYLKVTTSQISKMENGDSGVDLEYIMKLYPLYGLSSVDEFIYYQKKKNEEQERLQEEERKKIREENESIKKSLHNIIFCQFWDKEKGFCNEARIQADYDGQVLSLYQKENPNITLYEGCIGTMDINNVTRCYALLKGKWTELEYWERKPDNRWKIEVDFNNPIEKIKFCFDKEGIDDYEIELNCVYSDKKAYEEKILTQKRQELQKLMNIRVISAYDGRRINIVFNPYPAAEKFTYAVIDLYEGDLFLKEYRLPDGECILMEDKLAIFNWEIVLKLFDKDNNLLFETDKMKFAINPPINHNVNIMK